MTPLDWFEQEIVPLLERGEKIGTIEAVEQNRRCDNVEENKILRYGFFVAGIVFVLAVCWYLLREPAVHDQRDAARSVTESLDRVGSEQQRAAESARRIEAGLDRSITIIERVEERTGNASGAVDRAASGNEAARRIVEDSQRRITECEGIIQEIRSREGQN